MDSSLRSVSRSPTEQLNGHTQYLNQFLIDPVLTIQSICLKTMKTRTTVIPFPFLLQSSCVRSLEICAGITIDRHTQSDNGEEASYHEGIVQPFIRAEQILVTRTWLSGHLTTVRIVHRKVPQACGRAHSHSGG